MLEETYLGLCYERGDGVKKCMWTAECFYKDAINKGDAEAMFRLALIYESHGDCYEDRGVNEAIELFQTSADEGFAQAQTRLGVYYKEGILFQKNEQKAIEYFMKAAKNNDVEAQNLLAICYDMGVGVEKSVERAIYWYRKAALESYNVLKQEIHEDNDDYVIWDEIDLYRNIFSKNDQEKAKWVEENYQLCLEEAMKGHTESQSLMGIYNLFNDNKQQSLYQCQLFRSKARAWCELAAKKGEKHAQYWYSKIIEKFDLDSYDKSMEYLLKAAKQGHTEAKYEYGIESYHYMKKEYKKRVAEWLFDSANNGDSEAQFILGEYNDYFSPYLHENKPENSLWGEPSSYTERKAYKDVETYKAVEWYQKAANQGHVEALYKLGVCYEQGIGIERNEKIAVELYKKAIKYNHIDSQFKLAECYKFGKGIKVNLEKAKELYLKAAKCRHIQAQIEFVKCYENNPEFHLDNETLLISYCKGLCEIGDSYEKESDTFNGNPDIALKWYLKAAELGYLNAQIMVAWFYEGKRGIDKDINKAVIWYKKIAEKGVPIYMRKLSRCYRYGEGVEKDLKKSIEWSDKAEKVYN